jgi:hypothetical protein
MRESVITATALLAGAVEIDFFVGVRTTQNSLMPFTQA